MQVVSAASECDLQILQVPAEGALLVRPDGHIAWRAMSKELLGIDSQSAFQQLKRVLTELKN